MNAKVFSMVTVHRRRSVLSRIPSRTLLLAAIQAIIAAHVAGLGKPSEAGANEADMGRAVP